MNLDFSSLFFTYILPLPAILLAISVHEVCHGFVAYKLGDPTARIMGRLSLNPLRHLDPIGFLSLLILGFGAAKPVQVNSRNLRHPRRDMALVALAGPLSNLLMGFVGALFLVLCVKAWPMVIAGYEINTLVLSLFYFLQSFCLINLGLFAFNLIPLPPLDGSHILLSFLPTKYYWKIRRHEHIFSYVLLGLIVLSIVARRFPPLASFDILSLTLGNVRHFFYSTFIDFWAWCLGGIL